MNEKVLDKRKIKASLEGISCKTDQPKKDIFRMTLRFCDQSLICFITYCNKL